jgi:prepilin-type N-terminal cleavage/methylation domain-containing protein
MQTIRFRKRNKGFTLVELLLAVFILSVGIVGIMLLFSQSIISTEYAWGKTIAVSHAEQVLETMQLMDTLNEVTAMDWRLWADSQRLYSLPSESLAVSFANPSDDPLIIQVTINWVHKQRKMQVTLNTQMTK